MTRYKHPWLAAKQRIRAEEFLRQRKSGRSARQIADEDGISEQRVRRILKNHEPINDADFLHLKSTIGYLKSLPTLYPAKSRQLIFVYFIKPKHRSGPIKIGSSLSPKNRLRQFSSSSPLPLEIIGSARGSYSDEASIHSRLASYRLHGEWFEASPEVLLIMEKVIKFGVRCIK